MSHLMRTAAVTAAVALLSGWTPAVADEATIDAPSLVIAPAQPDLPIVEGLDSTVAVALPERSVFGPVVGASRLARSRGGADVSNDMQLRGVVADNRAINVTTGGNSIADGAFSGMAGLPMVVQNTGNNVLIQNATIINVQVK